MLAELLKFDTDTKWENAIRKIALTDLIDVIQFSHSVVSNSLQPMDCSIPGFPVHHQLLQFAQTYVYQVSDVIQSSHPLSSLSPPAFNLSQHQGLFQWVSSSHQVVKVLSFTFSISSSNEYSGLISFRMDWFDLLAAPGKGTINQTERLFQVCSASPCPWPSYSWRSNIMNRGRGARDGGYAWVQ